MLKRQSCQIVAAIAAGVFSSFSPALAAPTWEERADAFDFSASPSASLASVGHQSFAAGDFAERVLGGYRSFNFLRPNHRATGRNFVSIEPAEAIENNSGYATDATSYVVTPFNANLFSGVFNGVGSSGPKLGTTYVADFAVLDATWLNTTGLWSNVTKWSGGNIPLANDATVLNFGGTGSTPYQSTVDLASADGFTFGRFVLASSATVEEAITGENFNGMLAIGNVGSAIQQNGTGAFAFFNTITSSDRGTGVLSTTTLTLTGDGTGVVRLQGEIRDRSAQQRVGLLKDGTSTFILAVNNKYSVGTTVSGGTLLVNNSFGSGTGTGTVVVNNGGTLGGDGTISVTGPILPTDRTVTVNGGGVVAPGAAAGTIGALTMNATQVAFEATSKFLVDLTSTASDILKIIGGDLAPQAGSIIHFDGSPSSAPNTTYTLATYNAFTGMFTPDNTPSGYTLVYGPNSLLLTNDLALVPEPSTWIGGALALAFVGFMQRWRFAKLLRRAV